MRRGKWHVKDTVRRRKGQDGQMGLGGKAHRVLDGKRSASVEPSRRSLQKSRSLPTSICARGAVRSDMAERKGRSSSNEEGGDRVWHGLEGLGFRTNEECWKTSACRVPRLTLANPTSEREHGRRHKQRGSAIVARRKGKSRRTATHAALATEDTGQASAKPAAAATSSSLPASVLLAV